MPEFGGRERWLDRFLFAALVEISSTFENSAGEIWSEAFRPDLAPMVFFRRSARDPYGYAVNVCDPDVLGPTEMVVVDTGGSRPLVLERFGRAGVQRIDVGHQPARLDLELGGEACLAIAYDGSDCDATSHDFTRFVVHESFHMFQIFQARWRTPFGHDPALPFRTDRHDRGLAELEGLALDRAVSTRSFDVAFAHASDFSRIRRQRQQRRPDLVPLEHGYEQTEGTARYVENRYSIFNGRRWQLESPPAVCQHDHAVARLYRTGSQMCQLLDLVAPGWRVDTALGLAPAQLLAPALQRRSLEAHPTAQVLAAA